MKQLGEDARRANDAAAVTCYNARVSCENSCEDLATKYDTLVENCNRCASRTVYESAAADLRSSARTCANLSSFDNAAMQQAVSGSQSGGAGNVCEEVSAASPSGTSGGVGGGDTGHQMNQAGATSVACVSNPGAPGCATQAAAGATQNTSSATAAGPTAATGGSLNVGDTSGFTSEPTFGTAGGNSGDNVPKVKPIANNSGGGVPGSGGSGGNVGNGGIAGGNGAGGLFGAAKSTADINQGLRSGGYSAPAGGSGLEHLDGAEGFAGHPTKTDDDGAARDPARMDLKDYLPGGRLAADGIHTGSVMPRVREIGGPHVNLWTRISDKFRLMCKLGHLYDCN